jgi:hypothetical protein
LCESGGKYYLEDGRTVQLDKKEMIRAAQETKHYPNDFSYKKAPKRPEATKMMVIEFVIQR